MFKCVAHFFLPLPILAIAVEFDGNIINQAEIAHELTASAEVRVNRGSEGLKQR